MYPFGQCNKTIIGKGYEIVVSRDGECSVVVDMREEQATRKSRKRRSSFQCQDLCALNAVSLVFAETRHVLVSCQNVLR